VYLICVAVGGVAAFAISPADSAGMVGFFGFGTLAVLWEWTAWRGYRAIRERDIRNHQGWMIRNFALTYAAVTLRLEGATLVLIQIPFVHGNNVYNEVYDNAYAAMPFLCWLPNIVIAEWMVRRRGLPTLRMTSDVHTGRAVPRGVAA
jgi:dolichyl-phosphate-mannose--protein O-mannosyl transferase